MIGAHFASMLAAREVGRSGLNGEQLFDFVFTYDREIIVECAQALMLRIGLQSDQDLADVSVTGAAGERATPTGL